MTIWLESREIIHFQKELISEYGGLHGPPKKGMLESTLARPQNLCAYDRNASVFQLAASYGYGFARNHCFPDANKRIALTSISVFLLLNGYELRASETDVVVTIRSIADGGMTEDQLSRWIEENSISRTGHR